MQARPRMTVSDRYAVHGCGTPGQWALGLELRCAAPRLVLPSAVDRPLGTPRRRQTGEPRPPTPGPATPPDAWRCRDQIQKHATRQRLRPHPECRGILRQSRCVRIAQCPCVVVRQVYGILFDRSGGCCCKTTGADAIRRVVLQNRAIRATIAGMTGCDAVVGALPTS